MKETKLSSQVFYLRYKCGRRKFQTNDIFFDDISFILEKLKELFLFECVFSKGLALLKETECRLHNIRYIIMACIALHNLCIDENDPCEPRWVLEVDELDLIRTCITRTENKKISN